MKKIKMLLFAAVAATLLSSCTLDHASFGVSAVSYPSHRASYIEARPVRRHAPAIYHTTSYRYVDVRPDWMRYGGNWVPARRYYRR
jgi:hypothetical protein